MSASFIIAGQNEYMYNPIHSPNEKHSLFILYVDSKRYKSSHSMEFPMWQNPSEIYSFKTHLSFY